MHGSAHARNRAFGDLVVVGAMAVAADRLGQDLPRAPICDPRPDYPRLSLACGDG